MNKAHVPKNGWAVVLALMTLALMLAYHLGTTASGAGDMREAGGVLITKGEYGDLWPFPENESAELKCQRYPSPYGDLPGVSIVLSGKTFGLNGIAQTRGKLPDARLRMDVEGPLRTYRLGATSDIIKRGQRVCGL
jgi:hypothetical protein